MLFSCQSRGTFTLRAGGLFLAHRISTLEKLRAQQKASNSQSPSSKEAPSSKLKNRPARRLPPASDFEVWCLRFGTSLELGAWCLVFRSEATKKLRCAQTGRSIWVLPPELHTAYSKS